MLGSKNDTVEGKRRQTHHCGGVMPTTAAARSVVRRRPGPDLPAIRVRSAPALEPPYDDEATAPGWAGPGVEQMAFDLGLGAARPRTPPRAPAPAGIRATTG